MFGISGKEGPDSLKKCTTWFSYVCRSVVVPLTINGTAAGLLKGNSFLWKGKRVSLHVGKGQCVFLYTRKTHNITGPPNMLRSERSLMRTPSLATAVPFLYR